MGNWLPNVLGALPTSFVAAIAAYIAYQQWCTNRFQLRQALFDKRFEIFTAVQRYLSDILRNARVNEDEIPSLLRAFQRSQFLFDKDIPAYIDTIYRRSLRMRLHQEQYRNLPVGPQRTELVRLEHQELTWLTEQLPILIEKFQPYMAFGKS